MAKKEARVISGIRGVDALEIIEGVVVTKSWTEVSATDAKKLLAFEHKGRQVVEVRDAPSDKDEAETEGAKAKAAEQEDKS